MANLRTVAPALLLWVLCLVLTSVPAKAQSTIYSEDFEDGVANGFSTTGLRHVSTNTCPPTGSGAYALAYVRDKNLESGCNGDFLVEPCPNRPLECSPTSGSAITPSFLVPESGGRLSFVARVFSNDPNSSATFDGKWKPPIVGYDYLEVRINETPMIRAFGGGSTAVLNPSVLSSVGAFTEIDLDAFAGESIRVKFFFDSTDGVQNNYPGVRVDQIIATGQAQLPLELEVVSLAPTTKENWREIAPACCISIPENGGENFRQRFAVVKIKAPDEVKSKDTDTAKLIAKSIAGGQSWKRARPRVEDRKTKTFAVPVTFDKAVPSVFSGGGPVLPPFASISYSIQASADSLKSDFVDTPFRQALWRMPSELKRFGFPDPGGDGWVSKSTYLWLSKPENADALTRINDIACEHGGDFSRKCGHSGLGHQIGTGIDIFHFDPKFVAGPFRTGGKASANYLQLVEKVAEDFFAQDESPQAKPQVAEWFKKQRAGLDKLLSRPNVQKIYGLIGHDIVILPYGWGKQLLCKGKVEGVLRDGSDFDLGIGEWKTGKGPEACKRHSNIMGFNTTHNGHYHIDLVNP